MIRILSSREPYIRCGHHHRRQADYPDDHFSEEELARFEADPVLTVVRLSDVPWSDEGLEARLVAAICAKLEADPEKQDADWWTKGGKPEVAALETELEEDITASQRDRAWAIVQEAVE